MSIRELVFTHHVLLSDSEASPDDSENQTRMQERRRARDRTVGEPSYRRLMLHVAI